ncbi:MAG: hypothetical protein HY904_09725 [Deltaproteobacteria bacterium]|nr:hypothetical protein [Deltaproteobacteria bacterium]
MKLLAAGDSAGAQGCLRDALKLDPASARARSLLAALESGGNEQDDGEDENEWDTEVKLRGPAKVTRPAAAAPPPAAEPLPPRIQARLEETMSGRSAAPVAPPPPPSSPPAPAMSARLEETQLSPRRADTGAFASPPVSSPTLTAPPVDTAFSETMASAARPLTTPPVATFMDGPAPPGWLEVKPAPARTQDLSDWFDSAPAATVSAPLPRIPEAPAPPPAAPPPPAPPPPPPPPRPVGEALLEQIDTAARAGNVLLAVQLAVECLALGAPPPVLDRALAPHFNAVAQHCAHRLGGWHHAPRALVPAAQLQGMKLSPAAAHLFAQLDGATTLEDLVDAGGLPHLVTAIALVGLKDAGAIA